MFKSDIQFSLKKVVLCYQAYTSRYKTLQAEECVNYNYIFNNIKFTKQSICECKIYYRYFVFIDSQPW